MRHCRGICERYKTHAFSYSEGIPRCMTCDAWLDMLGIRCICCGNQFRRKSRDSRRK